MLWLRVILVLTSFTPGPAEIAVVEPDGAINIIFGREIFRDKDKKKKRSPLAKEYREEFANPCVSAEFGYIDKTPFLTKHDRLSERV